MVVGCGMCVVRDMYDDLLRLTLHFCDKFVRAPLLFGMR